METERFVYAMGKINIFSPYTTAVYADEHVNVFIYANGKEFMTKAPWRV